VDASAICPLIGMTWQSARIRCNTAVPVDMFLEMYWDAIVKEGAPTKGVVTNWQAGHLHTGGLALSSLAVLVGRASSRTMDHGRAWHDSEQHLASLW